MTRCWYFSVIMFVFTGIFIVEPFTHFILRFIIPASIYAKLRWMEDPSVISCLFRTKLYCSPVEIIPDENVQAFEKIGCRTPERLLEMKAVVDKPHEPVALPLLSKSLASSLAAHYGVESGNRRVPAVTQTFVENELLAEAAEGFEIVLQTHFKARIGERGKNCDFAVEHFTVAGTRHWRETTPVSYTHLTLPTILLV